MNFPTRNLLLFLFLALWPALAAAQTLKVATLAPDGSSWMETLREAGDEIAERTDGAVRLRFYPGGVMGDAATVLRRMRLGQLHGGAFTLGELASMAPSANLYSMPFQFRTAAELAAVRAEFDPFILERLEEAGIVAPALSFGGFAYLFSGRPVRSTDDVSAELRVWIPEGDRLSRNVLEEIGASAVPLSMAEVYTGLQTGTVNTFGSTMAGAIILQWHSRADYVLDLPLLATIGTMGFSERSLDRLDAAHREVLLEVLAEALARQERASAEENTDAREALAGQGIEFLRPDPEGASEWQRIADGVLDRMLAADRYALPGIERLRARLAELRAKQ